MKILFITDLYPIKPEEVTTPVTLHNFVIEWIRQGNKVDVIKPNFIFNSFLRGKRFYPYGFYDYQGVRVLNINYFTPFLFDVEKKIPKSFDFNNYDIIIAHMPTGIIYANKMPNKELQPLVCGVHHSDIEVLTNPLYKFYFKNQLIEAYKKAKKIACRSFVLQKKFNELMPDLADRTFVTPSGINSDEITIMPYNLPFSISSFFHRASQLPLISAERSIKVLTCANLIKRKNIDKLILAMENLEGFDLTVVGDGKELGNLKNLRNRAELLSHKHKVTFLGRLPHEKVLEEMQKADIFILPSVNETFGMVYLEAMASSCITVCTKGDGVDGIIKDSENGFLCEPTIEGIKEVLLKIKNCEKLEKIAKNSFETIKQYTQENCAKNYLINISK